MTPVPPMPTAWMFRPIVPPWLVVAGLVVLLGWCAFFLARQPRQRSEWTVRALMVLALAAILFRPGIGETESDSTASDLEVLVVVDRTTSMSALDWHGGAPRMTGVRKDLAALTEQFPGARFALVTFGRFVRTELPFSSDTQAFLTAVDTMQVEGVFDGNGSAISAAREEVQALLERAHQQHGDDRRRLVVFVSDGEDTSEAPRESFEAVAGLVSGGAVFGYGTVSGGRMPVDPERPDTLVQDRSTGEVALSRLDEEHLRAVADEMGVDYLHRERPGGLEEWAGDIEQGFTEEGGENPAEHELYWVFALLLLGLTLLELRTSWRGLLSAHKELRSRWR